MNTRQSRSWLVLAMVIFLYACGGGGSTSSSSGPTRFAGSYEGTITVDGFVNRIEITITEDGFVEIDVPGGILCIGDVPDRIGLDGDSFDATVSDECIVAGFLCPVNTIITGAVVDDTITGSGQVLLGCPNASTSANFSFVAREE